MKFTQTKTKLEKAQKEILSFLDFSSAHSPAYTVEILATYEYLKRAELTLLKLNDAKTPSGVRMLMAECDREVYRAKVSIVNALNVVDREHYDSSVGDALLAFCRHIQDCLVHAESIFYSDHISDNPDCEQGSDC